MSSQQNKPELKLYWCSFEAARYAVEHWHYSRCMPSGKVMKVGVCEDQCFVGCVMYASGATPYLGEPYDLTQYECCELVRVAMTNHKTPTSRVVAISLKMMKKQCGGLRLVVSFADRMQGHHGGIYQAGGWIYSGKSQDARFFEIKGRLTHPRSIGSIGGVQNIEWVQQNMDRNAKVVTVPGKHRYLMPLDEEMRQRIMPLSQSYPKRPPAEGGSSQ